MERLVSLVVIHPLPIIPALRIWFLEFVAMTLSYFSRNKLSKAIILRRTYRNWVALLLHTSPNRGVRLVLRDRRSIQLPSLTREDVLDSSITLAILLQHDWIIKEFDDKFVVMCDESGTLVKCRLGDLAGELFRLKEIFVDMVYGDDFAGKIVVDVGICNGDSSIFFAKKGARIVVGLEPFPESLELSLENIKLNGLGHTIIPLGFALASTSRDDSLVVAPSSTGHNRLLTSDDGRYSESNKTIPVRTISIADLVGRLNLNKIDILKIDCEGGEYEIIETMPETVARTIERIILEYHSGPRDLPARLSSFGFRVEVKGSQTHGGYLVATLGRHG